MNLRIFDTVDDLISGAARTITERATDGTSIALSGGSTPKPLYEILGRDGDLRERRITWVVVDERYVPLNDPQSNAGMIQHTLFTNGIAPHHRFLRFKTELDDPAATAYEFEREWRELHLSDLDIVILGMGDDGHTASLFPHTRALAEEDRLAVANYVPKLDAERLTLTVPVLNAAREVLFLVAGPGKAKTLAAVLEGPEDPEHLPAQLIRPERGALTWLVDEDAAASLDARVR